MALLWRHQYRGADPMNFGHTPPKRYTGCKIIALLKSQTHTSIWQQHLKQTAKMSEESSKGQKKRISQIHEQPGRV